MLMEVSHLVHYMHSCNFSCLYRVTTCPSLHHSCLSLISDIAEDNLSALCDSNKFEYLILWFSAGLLLYIQIQSLQKNNQPFLI